MKQHERTASYRKEDDDIVWTYINIKCKRLEIKRTLTVTKRKVREGEPCIALMANDLAHNQILDAKPNYGGTNNEDQEVREEGE